MDRIREAIISDAPAEEFASIAVPETYRGVTVHKDEADMFAGLPTNEKDPRRSLHLDDVPTPEPAPGELLVEGLVVSVEFPSFSRGTLLASWVGLRSWPWSQRTLSSSA